MYFATTLFWGLVLIMMPFYAADTQIMIVDFVTGNQIYVPHKRATPSAIEGKYKEKFGTGQTNSDTVLFLERNSYAFSLLWPCTVTEIDAAKTYMCVFSEVWKLYEVERKQIEMIRIGPDPEANCFVRYKDGDSLGALDKRLRKILDYSHDFRIQFYTDPQGADSQCISDTLPKDICLGYWCKLYYKFFV